MTEQLYAIYDKLAEEYGPLFDAQNEAVAQRKYLTSLKKHDLKEEEYVLTFIGTYDTDKGLIIAKEHFDN